MDGFTIVEFEVSMGGKGAGDGGVAKGEKSADGRVFIAVRGKGERSNEKGLAGRVYLVEPSGWTGRGLWGRL